MHFYCYKRGNDRAIDPSRDLTHKYRGVLLASKAGTRSPSPFQVKFSLLGPTEGNSRAAHLTTLRPYFHSESSFRYFQILKAFAVAQIKQAIHWPVHILHLCKKRRRACLI